MIYTEGYVKISTIFPVKKMKKSESLTEFIYLIVAVINVKYLILMFCGHLGKSSDVKNAHESI